MGFVVTWFHGERVAHAGGSVNVAITECTLGSDGIDVNYNMLPVVGSYEQISVDKTLTRNGTTIYSDSDTYPGIMECDNYGCYTCQLGVPCPPSSSFSATVNTFSAEIVATISFDWRFCDGLGTCTMESASSSANCSTPDPPPPDPCGPDVYWYQTPVDPDTCGEDTCAAGQRCESNGSGNELCVSRSECYAQQTCSPAYWYQSPVDPDTCGQGVCDESERCETLGGTGVCTGRNECTSTCGPPVYWYTTSVIPNTCGDGGCNANERCESNGGQPACTVRTQCTPPGTACTSPVSGTPTAGDCGGGGCPSTQYCQAGNSPICSDHNVCGSGPGANCAEIGEQCNQINTACCDSSQTCEFNSWANTQICISTVPICDVGVAGDQICQGICTFGGTCIPINPSEPNNGGTCDCTAGSGGISNQTTYEDEEVLPPEYIGPIVDFETMVSNLYKLILPLAIGFGGIPLVAIAGYRIMTSQGDPDRLKEGNEDLTATVAGLLYLLLALTILRIVLSSFL